jgi:hypothetical protein
MKNTIFFCFALVFQICLGQNLNHIELKSINFETNNLIFANSDASKIIKYDNFFSVDILINDNNSEGKFLVSEPKDAKIIDNFSIENKIENQNLTTVLKKDFIYKMIVKQLLAMDQKNIGNINISENSGDKNIELYKNYEILLEKLSVSYQLNDQIELQVGNNIYPFLKKIYKSEIDKTLHNSLNLFAINF